jgi:phospholipid/cholesterol/gamma-HCH transport system permease protein
MTDDTPRLELADTAQGWVLRLAGAWQIDRLEQLDRIMADLRVPHDAPLLVDAVALTGLDSAGVMLLVNRLRAAGVVWSNVELSGLDDHQSTLVQLIAHRLDARASPRRRRHRLLPLIGRGAERLWHLVTDYFAFFGRIVHAVTDLARRPGLFRARELTVQLEVAGLGALPIIALMTFLIGVVFAFLLGIQVAKFGANIFIVDGVGLAITRELAPLLTAILVAGRSGAAFTAQIGAMKVTEEIDAIATLGLSPIQVLVLPRLLALVLVMPLLAGVGDVMGVLGAALVADWQLDITPYTFFERLRAVLPMSTVLFGLYKTPVFAAAIAFIACRNGFAVSRDARSVGEHTTATVVQSLVAVILIDSAFAIAFPELK